jgi:AcrR family transcriptional regulator
MNGSNATKLPSRGRPFEAVRRDIVQDLMEAAEAALARKSAKEITIREIAAGAGADDAMIRYYFGGKDGLLISLIRDKMKNAPYKKYDEIIHDCISSESIHPLVNSLATHFYSRPNLIRMMIIEVSEEDSNIRSLYMDDRYSNETLSLITKSLAAMVDAGIYKKDINVDFTTSALIGMITAPALILNSSETLNSAEKINNPDWINYMAQAIDSTLKPRS